MAQPGSGSFFRYSLRASSEGREYISLQFIQGHLSRMGGQRLRLAAPAVTQFIFRVEDERVALGVEGANRLWTAVNHQLYIAATIGQRGQHFDAPRKCLAKRHLISRGPTAHRGRIIGQKSGWENRRYINGSRESGFLIQRGQGRKGLGRNSLPPPRRRPTGRPLPVQGRKVRLGRR